MCHHSYLLLNFSPQLRQLCPSSTILLQSLSRPRSPVSRSICTRTSPNSSPNTRIRTNVPPSTTCHPTSKVQGQRTHQPSHSSPTRNYKRKRKHKSRCCCNHPFVTSHPSICTPITIRSHQQKSCGQGHRSPTSVHRQAQRTQRAFSTRSTPRCPRISQFPSQQDRRRDGRRQTERCCNHLKWCYNGRRSIERRPYVFDELSPHAWLLTFLCEVSQSISSLNSSTGAPAPSTMTVSTSHPTNSSTFVHRLFEGVLTSETRCLTCETVSSRDESFLDLSIDIEQNSSVTACLRQFSASEMLCQKNKFFCDSCCDLQEAEKRYVGKRFVVFTLAFKIILYSRMKIKKLPNILALHLKRFKYQEDSGRYVKLAYRVAFPFQLRLFNTVDDADNPDRLYELFAIVVHIGA